MRQTGLTIGLAIVGGVALAASALAQGNAGWPKVSSQITKTARMNQWAGYWRPGRLFAYNMVYDLQGKFLLDIDRAKLPKAIKDLNWLEDNDLPMEILSTGRQGVTMMTLACGRGVDFWQMIAYSDNGTMRLATELRPGGFGWGREKIGSARVRALTTAYEEAEKSWSEQRKQKGGWEWVTRLKRWFNNKWGCGELEQTRREIDQEKIARLDEIFKAPLSDDGFSKTLSVSVDQLQDRLKNNPMYTSHAALRGFTAEFNDSIDGRLLFLRTAANSETKPPSYTGFPVALMEGPSPYYGLDGARLLADRKRLKLEQVQKGVTEYYAGTEASVNAWEQAVKDRRAAWSKRGEIIRDIELGLPAGHNATAVYRAVKAEERPGMWSPRPPKQKVMIDDPEHWPSAEDAFLEMHFTSLPHAHALLWGVERLTDGETLEFAPGCEGREVGAQWVIDSAFFDSVKPWAWSEYAFAGEVVVERQADATDPVSGRPCYVLKVIDQGDKIAKWDYDPRTKAVSKASSTRSARTAFALVPKPEETRGRTMPTFQWDRSTLGQTTVADEDNPLPINTLYVDKETGLLLDYNMPLVANIGTERTTLGKPMNGVIIMPGSQVWLNFSAQMAMPEDGDYSEKIKTAHPLLTGEGFL